MSNTPTEAHRKLATDLCRNATGSNRALHHVPKFAQLIADSEAQAVASAVTMLTCTHHNDRQRADCPVCVVAKLRAEVEHFKFLHQCESDSSVEAFARARRAEAEVERLGRATTNGQLNWMQESERQQARAERAESELANERDKVRVLRNAMKYLRNDDNYRDPQFDPCAVASSALDITKDAANK